jgi:hypothetical protein
MEPLIQKSVTGNTSPRFDAIAAYLSAMSTPTKAAADAHASKGPRSTAGLPAAALKRFAKDLEADLPSNKFLQINRDRVSDFINKKAEQENNEVVQASKKSSLSIPGICDYGNMNDPPPKPLIQLQSLPEFQTSLGARSRFGEGDGSFFDQWLNSDILRTKHLYDKDGFPVMRYAYRYWQIYCLHFRRRAALVPLNRFQGQTHTGFKKHLNDFKAEREMSKHYVPTYAERKAERLKRSVLISECFLTQ